MALRRMHNEDWGFATNCFACEPTNEGGLRIPFDHDDERDVVVATFTLSDTFSGAPSYVHGGISLTLLDEAQAWATLAVARKFAVTAETTTRFRSPVLVGQTYHLEAAVTEQDGSRLRTTGIITDADGNLCAESEATFVVLGPAQAAEATGADHADIDPDLLRDR